MVGALNLLGKVPRQHVCFKAMVDLPHNSFPFRSSCQFQQWRTRIQQQRAISIGRQKIKTLKTLTGKRGSSTIMSSMGDDDLGFDPSSPSETEDDDLGFGPSSPSETIKHFYTCINEKNLKQLEGYISEDCFFEECSFLDPFNGKKEVMYFFDQLTRNMGPNVKFSVENVCEGENFTAGVNWHLEWKETEVPFTRGCSFYECSKAGDRLLIKKARVVIESPIKPGGIVLVLLKNVTMVFDEFPKAAVWFLKSPQVILQFLLKIYAVLLAPIFNPILAGYLKVWELTALLFAFALKILVLIGKILFK
ncbi:hypothetical protein SLA2020_401610 [Shorea laevis]